MNAAAQKLAFAGSSRLTEIFPAFGARFLDATVRPVFGSLALAAMYARRNGAIEGARRFAAEAGHTAAGIGQRLVDALQAPPRRLTPDQAPQ
jgi:hypothetical protein